MTPRPMVPWIVKKDGRTYGNAAAAAALCPNVDTGAPILTTTFQWYRRPARVRKMATEHQKNLPPAYHHIDDETGQQMWDLDAVAKWQANRPGRGNWDGVGARARRPVIGHGTCPTCKRTADVDDLGDWVNHRAKLTSKRLCKASKTKAASYTAVD
jgi:hypothetical protein